MSWVPQNVDKPVIEVSHASLKRASDGPYRSHCPVCNNGFLLVRRDQKTLRLLKLDICLGCGQRVRYTDSHIAGEELF